MLDGGRGFAAFVVMLTHGFWTADLVQTGAFSVDYFFVLSGLVIAYAYQDRLRSGRMTARQFCRARFVRLYPMIGFGMLAGGALYAAGQIAFVGTFSGSSTLLATLAGLAMIPMWPDFLGAGLPWMFPTNIPAWSLLLEGIANLIYAPVAKYITMGRLCSVTAIFGAALALALWRHRQSAFGLVLPDISDGFLRVIYTFSAGMVIHRLLRRDLNISVAWLPVVAVVYLALCSIPAPWSSNAVHGAWALAAIIVFPAIVFVMAHMTPGPKLLAVCAYMGRLSYPLYMIHFPVVSFFNKMISHLHVHGFQLVALVCLQMSAAVAAAAASLHLFDEPARRWLSQRILRPRSDLAQESV